MWGCGVDLEPLSGALSDVNEEELKRKVAATVTKFAAVRGDFRYQVLCSSSAISAALQHSALPPLHMPLQLPFSALLQRAAVFTADTSDFVCGAGGCNQVQAGGQYSLASR
jgi:hypothetical protein